MFYKLSSTFLRVIRRRDALVLVRGRKVSLLFFFFIFLWIDNVDKESFQKILVCDTLINTFPG